jgi:hypothetical protein
MTWKHAFWGTTGVDVPMLPDGPVPPLTYADDVALLFTSTAGLQRQLGALESYAVQEKLTVNIDKTEVVVYKERLELTRRWTYGGQQLKVADCFNYLGCVMHAARRYGEDRRQQSGKGTTRGTPHPKAGHRIGNWKHRDPAYAV